MKISIDGKEILVNDASKNIVEIAKENGIHITAPCFNNGRQGGCCKVCVIEIDGIEKYACGTKPSDGMTITYNREDLERLRKDRLEKYTQALKSDIHDGRSCCSGGCDCSDSSCCK